MPTATTIVEVCDALREALRRRGFFAQAADDATRRREIEAAVEETSRDLGLKLTASEKAPGSGHTVLADGIPGMVTIVSQRRVAPPAGNEAKSSVDPDFEVNWTIA